VTRLLESWPRISFEGFAASYGLTAIAPLARGRKTA
jgi:hypothetical protein